MSRHTTYRGVTVDMDSMRRENETVPAIGNAGTNARGDKISRNGVVTKTSDQIARENNRIQTSIVHGSVKPPIAEIPGVTDSPITEKVPVASTNKKVKKETELSNGDIVVDDATN